MSKKLCVKLFFLVFFLFCKKPKPITFPDLKHSNPQPIHALVVLSSGESKISHADLTEERASIGAFFRNGDKIVTGSKSKLDIQIEGSAILRLGPNTILTFQKILNPTISGIRETVIELEEGIAFLKVSQISSLEKFLFFTSVVVGEVKGTEFIINSTKGKSKVKVLEGKIILRPRIRAIEPYHSRHENPTSTLMEIENKSTSQEIIVESQKEANLQSISPILEKEIISEEEARIALKLIDRIKWKSSPIELTKSEEQELKTLVMEDAEITRQMIEVNEELSSGKVDDTRAMELEALRSSLENKIRKKQDIEKAKFNDSIVVLPKKLKTKREIIKYYERMEKIILKGNRVEVGAIISQEGDVIIVHTENGIRRIPNEDVIEVIYEYQRKIRY
jgi:hypothetical protein